MSCVDPPRRTPLQERAKRAARGLSLLSVLLLCACASLTGHPAATAGGAGEATAGKVPADAAAAAQARKSAAAATQAGAAGTAPAQAGTAAVVPAPPPLDPSVTSAYQNAVAELQAGKAETAQADFLALVRSHPELGGPHANLGILYRRAGKLDEAAAEGERSVQAGAGQAVYWNQLGITYRVKGDFAKARAAYEKAIALDPSYAAACLNLGVLFDLYLWDSVRALEQYEQYLALTPGGDPEVTKWIADLKNRVRAQAAKDSKEQGQ